MCTVCTSSGNQALQLARKQLAREQLAIKMLRYSAATLQRYATLLRTSLQHYSTVCDTVRDSESPMLTFDRTQLRCSELTLSFIPFCKIRTTIMPSYTFDSLRTSRGVSCSV